MGSSSSICFGLVVALIIAIGLALNLTIPLNTGPSVIIAKDWIYPYLIILAGVSSLAMLVMLLCGEYSNLLHLK